MTDSATDLRHQPGDDEIVRWLNNDAPNLNGLMMLYDRTAAAVWTLARQRTKNRRQARQVCVAAFITAAQSPAIFAGGTSLTGRMLTLIYLETGGITESAPKDRPHRRRSQART